MRISFSSLGLFLLLALPSLAHDMSDPDAEWYQSLVVPGDPSTPMSGSSCCNGGKARDADCKNVETRERQGHWEAYIDSKTFPDTDYSPTYGHAPNEWVRVPEGGHYPRQGKPDWRSGCLLVQPLHSMFCSWGSNMTDVSQTARSFREQGLIATVHRACRTCGAPGVFSNHDWVYASFPACYVEDTDIRTGQPVGTHCPACRKPRDPGLKEFLGEIWRRRFA